MGDFGTTQPLNYPDIHNIDDLLSTMCRIREVTGKRSSKV
ncbi:MAG: hypothetical protein ACJAUG_002867 [Halioglobus sp.]